jgi:dTDP-4-dehydrorhamnose reductase
MKIAIIGASGFLGTKLMNALSKKYEIVGASIDVSGNLVQLDAMDRVAVESFLKKENPAVVIDTVALTSSLACEQNPSLCKKLNFQTAKNIAYACRKVNAKMIFISSSYVFDGIKGDYSEKDKPNPLNEYGKFKVLAEKEVLKIKDSIVLRTTIMYGYNGKDKGNGVFGKMLSGETIRLGDPFQLRNPIFVEDVVSIILSLLEKKQNGLFHMAGSNKMTMFDFLKRLEGVIRKDSRIVIENSSKPLVNHPKNDTLNTKKLDSFGIKVHTFEQGLDILKKQISS